MSFNVLQPPAEREVAVSANTDEGSVASPGGIARSKPAVEPGRGRGGGQGMGEYMQDKVRKLRESVVANRLAAQAAGSASSAIFAGVCVWVDGFTSPSHAEIQVIMTCHGGTFEHYYDGDKVTHVIAQSLAHTHLLRYRKMRRPPKIVRPAWLTACVEQGKLLDVGPYLLERTASDDGQCALTAFSAPRAHTAQPQRPARSPSSNDLSLIHI